MMTPETLAGIAGLLLSLAFSYVPGLSSWYNGQASQYKSLIMLATLVVAALVVFGLGCAGLADVLGASVTCDQAGAIVLVRAFIAALVANQATFLISPQRPRGEDAEILQR